MMDTIDGLLDEVRLMWHRMVEVGERLHAGETVTLGMRGVLEALLLRGPATVPALARSRHVTRQHIQVLVNELLVQGLLAQTANPAHRRSPLIELTREGERVIRRMKRREARLFERVRLGVASAAVAQAARTLRLVREALDGSDRHA